MSESPDIQSARLSSDEIAENFSDLHPPLTLTEAVTEASRCLYCYDAPCVTACPTSIPIPHFIKKIEQENPRGSAFDILSANIMGGTCARVCPVESLCEGACVRHTGWKKPIQIGELQRFATDHLMKTGKQPFEREVDTGKRVAVVGGGPAGLSCAHRLARWGHSVTVFEAKKKLGGLNEYGLAPYKMVDDFAQKEADFILSVGGIEVETGKALGKELSLSQLKNDFDAVFLGVGLSGVNALWMENEEIEGIHDAVASIEDIRQAPDLSQLKVGNRVVVIGGGSTAIDIAMQSKRLGAEEVTIVYRRGLDNMRATHVERELAQTDGVSIRPWAKPHRITGDAGHVVEMEFERTELSDGKLTGTESYFSLKADVVFKAIGQVLQPENLGDAAEMIQIEKGRIVVDDKMASTVAGVYAGGDCINGGDLTVTAVEHGKVAAQSIHEFLGGQNG